MNGGPKGLPITLAAVAAAAFFAGHPAYSNPVGPVVVNGQAAFQSTGASLSVTNSSGAIINWQRFSIGAGEATRFIQQSAASAVLNRVTGGDPSRILGALQSNGRVFLINPNGIVFGRNSQIDVAGLVASTLNLSNADFIAGRLNFTGDQARAAAVVNLGSIAASPGGSVYLIGGAVDNRGVITAPNGDVVLAAGQSVRVTESAASGVQVEITAPADGALNLSEALHGTRGIYAGLVRNRGTINADSAVRGADGRILLKASGGVTLDAGSRVSANGPDGGRVVVDGQQGAAAVSGSVEATGNAGRGGDIAITGAQTGLLDGARVDASGASGGGTVLIGGDLHGAAIRDGETALSNSRQTYVAPAAALRADAIEAGDGGKIVVWADESTRYYGNISARGGARGGDGGSVEVSGKRNLAFDGKVDTAAPRGRTGSLLLDPDDLFISAGVVGGAVEDTTNPFQATDGTNNFYVTAATLEALPATTAIDLQANHDIIFQTGLSMPTAGAGSITLTAANQIQMASFGLTTAGGGVSMNAGPGGITNLGPINLAGGLLTLNSSGSIAQGAGVISGSTSLQKLGSGTLTLSNVNTFTGPTTVDGGTLALAGGNAIANTVAVTVGAAGTLDLQNGETIGSLSGVAGAQVTLNANTLTTGDASNTTFGGVVSGAGGGLTKQGTGTFTLSGANTYTGATTVSAGVLNLQNATAAGTSAGGVTVASGAALELQGGIAVGNEALSITGTGAGGNGALRNVSGDNTWGGTVTLTGGGATIQSDANTLTLSNANAVTGAAQNVAFAGAGNVSIGGTVTTTTGTVAKTGAGTLFLGASNLLSDTGSLVVNGGTFDMAGFSDTVGGVQLLSGTVTSSTGILTSATDYDLQSGSVSAIIAGAVGVNKSTAGTVTLTRANTYTGATAVNAGTLAVTSNDGLGSSAAGTTVQSGATLDFQNVAYTTLEPLTLNGGALATSTGTSSFANVITLTAASIASVGTGVQLTLPGAISDGGNGFSLTKTGAGTLTMGASNLLADTMSLVVNGGVFDLGTFSDTVAGVQLLSGSITGTTGTLTSTSNFDLQSGSVSAILAGGVGAVKTTTGTVTLSAANTYAGATAINGGVLSVDALANGGVASGIGQSSNAAANLTLGGGTLQYTGATVTIDRNFTLTAGTTSSIDVNPGATNLTLTGNGAATSGSLSKLGAGTLTLSGNNLYTGTTTVSAGTLALAASERLHDSSNLVVNGGTFSIGGFNETLAGVRLAGGSIAGTTGILTSTSNFDLQSGSASAILTGSVGAVKTTTGTVTLSGTNTYTGATTINAGVLSVSALASGGFASNIGQSSNAAANLTLGGGTLQYTGATMTIDRNFTLTAGTTSSIDVNPGATNLTLTGAGVATSGSLTKLGAGTLTLLGNNLYTGTTTVSAGTLAYGTDNALATGPVTVSGGAWNVGAFSDSVGTVTLVDGAINGTTGVITGTFYDVRNGSISAILAGGAALTKTTTGTVTLSGHDTYTGTTTVSDGRLVLGASDVLDDATHLVVNGSNATFDIVNFSDTVAGVQLLAGTITGTSGVLTSKSDFDLQGGTVSAILDGFTPTIGVVKSGPGTVTLTRANLYGGATAVNGGTLAVTSNDALGTIASGTTVETGAALDFQNVAYTSLEPLTLHGGTVATSTGTSSFAGPATLTADSFASVTGTQLTLSGAIGESGGTFGLTKVGAGTLVLSAHDTYQGTTRVNAGTVRLGVTDALDDASKLVVNGGTFDIQSFTDTVAGVQLLSGTITGGSGVLTSTSNYDLQSGTVSAIITGTVGVDKTTAGTVTLSRDNTYTGATAVAAGTLRVTAPNALGTTAVGTTVSSGATLSIVNTAVTVEPVTLNGNGVGGAGALTGTGTASLAGSATLATASTIGVTAAADALTLSGVIEGPGALSLIGAGTVTFGNTVGAATALASLTQNAATRLNINGGLVRTTGSQTYNGLVTTGGAATLRTAGGAVSSPGKFTATAGTLTLDTGAGSATLANVLNDFGTVQVTSGGAVSLVDANGISIGGAIMNTLSARALSGNLIVSGTVTATGADDSIVLVASGNFANNVGAAALNPGAGRWLVYSTNPTLDTRGGLAYDFKQYHATFGVTAVADPRNGFLYTVAPTVTPTLTGTVSKNYDATTAATLGTANYAFPGAIDGDTIDLGNNALTGLYDTPDVGTAKLVSVSGLSLAGPGAHNGTAKVYGYQLTTTSTNGNVGVIGPASLTITPSDQTKTYGDAFAFTGAEFSSSGLQGGQTVGSVALASAGAPATANVAGSPYAITASGAGGGTFNPGNYTITYASGQLAVSPAPLTLTANDQVKAYGGSPFVFTGTEFTSSGLKNADAIDTVTLTSAAVLPNAPVALSPYAIVPSAATGAGFAPGNYAITYVNGVFTVNPAGVALTVTANNQTKPYGNTLIFTGSEFAASGLENNETIGRVVLASAGASATAHVAGGPYPITVSGASGGTFTPGNYTISYVPGLLTVAPAQLTLTVRNQTKTYGTEVVFTPGDFALTGLKNNETTGTVVLSSPGAPAKAHVAGSPYTITPRIESGGTYTPGDYNVTMVPGQITVLGAPLTVKADDQSRSFGAANPLFTATYTGFRAGEGPAVLTGALNLDTLATRNSPPARYAIVPSGQSATDYAITFLDGALTVRPSLLGLPAGLTNQVIVELGRLGIDRFNREIVNCLGEDIAAPAIMASIGIGLKPPRNCTPSAVDMDGIRKSPKP